MAAEGTTRTPAAFNPSNSSMSSGDGGANSTPPSGGSGGVRESMQEAVIKFGDSFDDTKVEHISDTPAGDTDEPKRSTPANPRAVDPTKKGVQKQGTVDPTEHKAGPAKTEPKFDVEAFGKKQQEGDATTEPEPAPSKPGKRDYTAFDPEDAELLSEMPNAKFEKFSKLLPEWRKSRAEVETLRKQLADRPPETVQYWYDNEEAYRLQPEFKQAEQLGQRLAFEETHWRSQLAAIKAGEEWHELVGYDKNGTPQFRVHPARDDGRTDADAEASIIQMLSQYATHGALHRNKMEQLRAQFAQSVKNAGAEIGDAEKKLFPRWQEKEKLTKEDQEAVDLVRSLYPRHMQNHPAVRHAGMTFREFQRLGQMFETALKEKAELEKEVKQLKARLNMPVNGTGSNVRPAKPGQVADTAADEDDEVIDLKALNKQFAGR